MASIFGKARFAMQKTLFGSSPLDKMREECGVAGVFGHQESSRLTYLMLYALQHRGQEAAGIVSFDGEHFHTQKARGHVGDNFTSEEMIGRLPGSLAIGHTRYSTTGEPMMRNVQPLLQTVPGVSEARILPGLAEAVRSGAELVVTPEVGLRLDDRTRATTRKALAGLARKSSDPEVLSEVKEQGAVVVGRAVAPLVEVGVDRAVTARDVESRQVVQQLLEVLRNNRPAPGLLSEEANAAFDHLEQLLSEVA